MAQLAGLFLEWQRDTQNLWQPLASRSWHPPSQPTYPYLPPSPPVHLLDKSPMYRRRRRKSRTIPLLFVHGLVRLRQEFSEGDGILRVEASRAYAQRKLITSFARIRCLQVLLETPKNDVLVLT